MLLLEELVSGVLVCVGCVLLLRARKGARRRNRSCRNLCRSLRLPTNLNHPLACYRALLHQTPLLFLSVMLAALLDIVLLQNTEPR